MDVLPGISELAGWQSANSLKHSSSYQTSAIRQMKVQAQVITDPKELPEDELEVFLKEYSPNPFMLFTFTRNLMSQNGGSNWAPVVIIVRVEEEIIGVAPLALKRYLGIRHAEFLGGYWMSPDFVLKSNYESIAVETIVRIILEELNSRFILLDMESNSPNLRYLKRVCARNGIPMFERSYDFMDHAVVTVDCSWDDYEKSCGAHFAKKLRKIRNRLDGEGNWRLNVVEGYDECSEEALHEKIMAVEKLSWKGVQRRITGSADDWSIEWMLTSSSHTRDNRTVLGRKVWFLELDGRPVAYAMVFQYKGVAYTMKTSFVEQCRKLGLGKYLKSASLKDLFDGKEVQKIDFMSYFPYMAFWRVGCVKRLRVTAGNRAIVDLACARSVLGKAAAHLGRGKEHEYSAPEARKQLAEVLRRAKPSSSDSDD
jgi:hypothetical protein